MYNYKHKRNGYLILENIVSLSLIGIMASLVVSIFSTSVFNLEKSYNTSKMINLAKKEMCSIEDVIQNNKEENLFKRTSKNIEGYTVKSEVIKERDNFNCYRVSVCVSCEEKEMMIDSYVVRT
ncbi:type II secretion system protein [Paraclostridium bifermentans]|uniref:type II secretion system protein n=1 Tax=Paraclostridium bifermentans TaxID=1490 RepID=UPI001896F492|nr:type II secretion system protein [Paraclostridium bifermentans]